MPAEPNGKGSRRVRIGKYEVLAHVATGGMGAVYRALDTDLGREVALKVLSPEMAARPAMLKRFRREARSAARLRHENIVTIYEFAEANGTYFLALEFVDGTDLHDFIGKRGRLDPELARQILIQAARALAHAHEQGIVHRDIKPSNLLVAQKDGRLLVKLTDLGLAREAGDEEYRITRLGSTVGTLDYMSPEQARDSAAADIRSDIYSLGCTFYHMLAGKCPFPQGSPTERIYRHDEGEPPDVRGVNPNVPAGLIAVLRKMLEKKPADRYQTPQELLSALEDPATVAARPAPVEPAAETVTASPRPPSSTARTRAARLHKQGSSAEARAAAARPTAPTKKRFRGEKDEDEDEDERLSAHESPSTSGLPPWWPWAACVVGVVVLAVVAFLSLGSYGRPRKQDEPPPKEKRRPDQPGGAVDPGQGQQGRRPAQGGAPGRSDQAELARLRTEFEGPLRVFPAPPADAAVIHVSRSAAPGPASFRSLAEACATAPAGRHTVIEIHDNGPLFEPAVPAVSGRSLTVRAGPGRRPLIAWDGAGGAADRFLVFANGDLTLDGLDLVVKWPAADRPTRPAVLLALTNARLAVRDCTFSVSGRHPQGVQAIRLEGRTGPVSCRLSHCYLRGASLTAVAVHDATADVLLDESLIVSAGGQPLLDVQAPADRTCTLRLVRSTLVVGSNLLRVTAPAGRTGSLAMRCLCWGALLSRPGAGPAGELIHLAGGAGIERLDWRAANAVYAGWETVRASAGRVLPQPWPADLPSGLAECAPGAFDATSLTAAGGQVGCDLRTLPAGRAGWLGLTYDRFVTAPLALPGDEVVPPIPALNDGRYHGERIELGPRIPDLGKLLRERLQNAAPGPRVVLHIVGDGEHRTSPIQLRGADLVLYFHPAQDRARPLTLAPEPTTTGGKSALIEVVGGSLEMTGARVVFGNSAPTPLPVRVVRVYGGSLRLSGCRLKGPLTNVPPGYRALIEFAGSGKDEPARAHACALNRCVLQSGRKVLTVRGKGVRVGLRQCVLLALDDALHFDLAAAAGPGLNVHCTLDHNTIAARHAAFVLRDAPKLSAGFEPVVIQADDNLFLDPFAEAPPRSCMLSYERDALARGLLLWQGKGNGYDARRLHAYSVADTDAGPARQTHPVWTRLWGHAGEQQAHLLEWPATASCVVNPEHPQLDRLRLPAQARAMIGADLARLGIAKER